MPVFSASSDSRWAWTSRLSSGARDYHLTGTLHFETQLGDIAVAIDHQGSLEDLR